MKKEESADKSPFVPQRDKFNKTFRIKEFPWTEKQQEFIQLAQDKNTRVIFVTGPAGSSKTLISIYVLLNMLREKKISDISYIRSAVESADSHLGSLPGTFAEKMYFYNLPMMEKLSELLNKEDIEILLKDERIISFAPNFARGMSWNAKGIIIDESQSVTFAENVTLLTRLGKYCKCFVLADPTQSDLKNGKRGGFEKLFKLFSDQESQNQGIFTFEFTEDDIVRSGLCQYIVKKIKTVKQDSN